MEDYPYEDSSRQEPTGGRMEFTESRSPKNTRSPSRERSEEGRRPDDRLGYDEPREGRRQEEDADNAGGNLFVSGLTRRTVSRDLEELFAKYGDLESANVVMDPHDNVSRGFGFVTFKNSADAQTAATALNQTELDGRRLIVELAKRNKPRQSTPGQYMGAKPRTRPTRSDSYAPRSGGDRNQAYGGRDGGRDERRYDSRDRESDRGRERGHPSRDRYERSPRRDGGRDERRYERSPRRDDRRPPSPRRDERYGDRGDRRY